MNRLSAKTLWLAMLVTTVVTPAYGQSENPLARLQSGGPLQPGPVVDSPVESICGRRDPRTGARPIDSVQGSFSGNSLLALKGHCFGPNKGDGFIAGYWYDPATGKTYSNSSWPAIFDISGVPTTWTNTEIRFRPGSDKSYFYTIGAPYVLRIMFSSQSTGQFAIDLTPEQVGQIRQLLRKPRRPRPTP